MSASVNCWSIGIFVMMEFFFQKHLRNNYPIFKFIKSIIFYSLLSFIDTRRYPFFHNIEWKNINILLNDFLLKIMEEYMDTNSPDRMQTLKPRVLTYGLSPDGSNNQNQSCNYKKLNESPKKQPTCSPPYRKVRALR